MLWLPGVRCRMCGSWTAYPPRMLAVLSAALPEALFLVEADGAARKPLKAPAAHEPVLPEPLGCCVAVVGLDAWAPLDDGHVHRSALVCAAAGQEPGSPVTPATLACLVETPKVLPQLSGGVPPSRVRQ